MFQVLVRPDVLGMSSWSLASRAERDAFTRRSDVWWYMYAEDDGWDWHKGGAWEKVIPDTEPTEQTPSPAPAFAEEPSGGDDDEDDERW